jgi:hypothetical protein
MSADKTVGGRTREERQRRYLHAIRDRSVIFEDLLAAADVAHSRGIREGLERAAKVLCPSCAAGVPVKGDKHDNGVALPYHCLAYLVRAEASKLDGTDE